jgi:hypothetical protein
LPWQQLVKARILALDSEEHRKAQELLPWFVTETLDASERAQVSEHLVRCSICQEGAAALRQLRDTPLEAAASERVDLGWTALRPRLDAPKGAPSRASAARAGWRDGWRVAVAVQFVVIVALALALVWDRSAGEPYRALGTVPASEANAIAVFRADATQAQMSAALRAAQARVVGGPTITDAYLLRLPDADPAALDRLRAQPGVLDVQSLQAQPLR